MQYKFTLSPKLRTILIDGAVTLALYFVGKYASASLFDDAKLVIGVIQPIVAVVLLEMYQSEQAQIKAGERPSFMALKK